MKSICIKCIVIDVDGVYFKVAKYDRLHFENVPMEEIMNNIPNTIEKLFINDFEVGSNVTIEELQKHFNNFPTSLRLISIQRTDFYCTIDLFKRIFKIPYGCEVKFCKYYEPCEKPEILLPFNI